MSRNAPRRAVDDIYGLKSVYPVIGDGEGIRLSRFQEVCA